MRISKRTAVAVATVGTGAVLAGTAVMPAAATAAGARTITVTVTGTSITLSTGTSVSAGFARFVVKAPKGQHTLQLLRLAPGYTPQQAGHDINAAFGGNLQAIHRVDTKIRWFGGAAATPERDGQFAETLYSGTYYFVDQEGNAKAQVTVTGTPTTTSSIAPSSTITAFNTKKGASRFSTGGARTLPRSGWTLFRDHADQPHFLVIQHVKDSTTAKDIRAYQKSGGQSAPTWAAQGETDAGVISPDTQILFHYHLPAGKYVITCFWPDAKTGMEHFAMGMWKLVTLK